jgi:D-sedoheptulose 7-phosphate isomerase
VGCTLRNASGAGPSPDGAPFVKEIMESEIFHQHIQQHREVLEATVLACEEPLRRLVQISVDALRDGGKILFFGNGGSAADAQHLAAELAVRFIEDRKALAGLALTTDSSVLTACGNDFGFDLIFARQIEAIGRRGDVAIGLTTSGNSPNIICGLERARSMGIAAAAFAGCGGGKLAGVADPLLIVPARGTARIQEMHILLGHIFCTGLERELFGA